MHEETTVFMKLKQNPCLTSPPMRLLEVNKNCVKHNNIHLMLKNKIKYS